MSEHPRLPADPLEDPAWWARLYADLEAEGVPVPEEETPAEAAAALLAAFPEEAPWWVVPDGFTGGTVVDLARSPGVELTAAVEDLLMADDVPADVLLALVEAAHRSANQWAAVRAQLTARLADAWTTRLAVQRPSRDPSERGRRLRQVEREALRRWRRGTPTRRLPLTDPDADGADDGDHGEAVALGRAFTIAEVSLACGVSRSKAAAWLATGSALAAPDRLTATAQAAARGLLDEAKVTEIVRATAPVDDRVAQAVDALIVPRAALPEPGPPADLGPGPLGVEISTVPWLKDELAAAMMSLDPEGARARAETAQATRKVTWRRLDPTMGELRAVLPVLDGARILARLDEEAHSHGAEDPRTFFQRRADALTDLCLHEGCVDRGRDAAAPLSESGPSALVIDEVTGMSVDPDTGEITSHPADAPGSPEAQDRSGPPDGRPSDLGRRRGPRTQIVLTVPWETVAGIGDAPGTLAGYGPLPADRIRAFVHERLQQPEDLVWRCAVVTDDHATLLGLGTKAYTMSYRPPAGVRRFTTALYGHSCAFPGCDAPADRCDFDHVRPWPDGPTCTCNGIPLCRPCHRLKTTRLIDVRTVEGGAGPPGSLDWTTATGRTYRSRPPTQSPPTPEQLAATLTEPAPPY